MYVKIQSKGLAGGDNSGSCKKHAVYLGHESRWKEEQGLDLDIIPMYDHNGNPVSEAQVIKAIDNNRKHLRKTDAKFYTCIISFSEKEAQFMGDTRSARISATHELVGKAMDRYARGFGCEGVKDRKDLMYFYTIHEFREKKGGRMEPGLHVHVIISRKDITNTYHLSPMTSYKEGSISGIIKRGFNRNAFFKECETIFDETFTYKRKTEESFDYMYALARGTNEEKDVQIAKAVREQHIADEITAALLARISRLAREAEQTMISSHKVAKNEEKARRDRFWNDYFSYYKPQVDKLKKACSSAFQLYREAQDKYNIQSGDIAVKKQELKNVYDKMESLENTINRAETVPLILFSITALIALVDVMPAYIIGLATAIIISPIAKCAKQEAIDRKRSLRRQAADIREDLIELREMQTKLKDAKNNSLATYLKEKEDRTDIQKQLDTLKQELEKPLEKNSPIIDLAMRYKAYKEAKETAAKEIADTLSAHVYDLLISSKDKLSLELELQKQGITITEIVHENGGVANLMIESKGQTLLAGESYYDRMNIILDRWESLTGKTPAYKIQENKLQPQNRHKL